MSLFAEDVEWVLRDLYGDLTEDAAECVRHAVIDCMQRVSKKRLSVLWQEFDYAKTIDLYCWGIGSTRGERFSGTQRGYGDVAACQLVGYLEGIRDRPRKFSQYTLEFVKRFDKQFPAFEKEVRRWERSAGKNLGVYLRAEAKKY